MSCAVMRPARRVFAGWSIEWSKHQRGGRGRKAMLHETRFRAMGSDAHIAIIGDATLPAVARLMLERLEERWSRFRLTSEVSIMNARAGRPTPVSDVTLMLIMRSIDAWRSTGGAFDPTIGRAIIAAGYDRTFEELTPQPTAPDAPAPAAGCGSIVIDQRARLVTLPPGVTFDPGGIGKGLAADLIAEELLDAGARGACVSIGGDLRVCGDAPDDGGWLIEIDVPSRDVMIAVRDGAVATSSTARRSWIRDGRMMHHIIDPRSGAPARTDLVQVSVVADEAWRAEAWATAAMIEGTRCVDAVCARGGVEAIGVDTRGTIIRSVGWETAA